MNERLKEALDGLGKSILIQALWMLAQDRSEMHPEDVGFDRLVARAVIEAWEAEGSEGLVPEVIEEFAY